MSKKYYPIEDAVNNVSQKFKLGLKDANEMDEEEFNNVEEYILKYVKFVSHAFYAWTQHNCGFIKKERADIPMVYSSFSCPGFHCKKCFFPYYR